MSEEKPKGGAMKMVLILLVVLLVMGGAGFMTYKYVFGDNVTAKTKPVTAEELAERSFTTEDMTTNIQDERFINVQFTIVTDAPETKEDLELRKFQVHNVILGDLAGMTKAQLTTKEDMQKFEQSLRAQLNGLLEKGEVQRVYMTKKIIQ
ncbi:flagellar basal body protein FliL [Exiguobacterium sp. SH3S2]|uniref:flagellar basal body-associated FliL family protein n=1 Tax=unclassified Exiguobacterium TaxID=2644629 RepID=UPI001038C63F|nr:MULTISPECIES: flagellar basal body-associated FliL family protein [unclassified Exiguobacterium]TCI27428.1 flagellar basal body protein FliL [Exiguobacterium sp. SH5S4]TCI49249.1 flagellar basal body protein FliL [Exiguobacterium sp. SH3S3]TCI57959.1 flagellar basal body protein FliL [Exiguobacterium sp. SH5S13]TCI64562.1 flagellar basal body protein FliL [Exiguobacterium sp. SH3S2]TCI66111.1 flagellar basal body protein FliL [Exiguobacterium sp. SH3S1]